MIVLDNCEIHHDDSIYDIIVDECGMFPSVSLARLFPTHISGTRLIYLPPYSLDFNQIKELFHTIKAWLRIHETEVINPDVCREWHR